jgi:hypothetical protein
MAPETQVIVGAEIERLAPVGEDNLGALGGDELAFLFIQPLGAQVGKTLRQIVI